MIAACDSIVGMDEEARVELLCMNLPEDATDAEVHTAEQTREMWAHAEMIARHHHGDVQMSEHEDRGMLYGDAYAFISLRTLELVLDAFDDAGIVYDYVDLPKRAPKVLVKRIQRRYQGSGVRVTVGHIW